MKKLFVMLSAIVIGLFTNVAYAETSCEIFDGNTYLNDPFDPYSLNQDDILYLQNVMSLFGYYESNIDGVWGTKSNSAYLSMISDIHPDAENNMSTVGYVVMAFENMFEIEDINIEYPLEIGTLQVTFWNVFAEYAAYNHCLDKVND